MAESAAHLIDHVFPEAPVRQRRLSRHGGLRACSQEALSACRPRVGADFSISSAIPACRPAASRDRGTGGGVHLHMLFLDGAYQFHGSRVTFHRTRRPDNSELIGLLDTLSRRIIRVLERRGLLIADPVDPYLDLGPGSSWDQMQAASIADRIAIGPHAGRRVRADRHARPPADGQGSRVFATRRHCFTRIFSMT
jgi:hypothetical protein